MFEIVRATNQNTCCSVVSEDTVTEGTVADERLQEAGGIIRLPFPMLSARSHFNPDLVEMTNSVFVPPMIPLVYDNGMAILDPILSKADNLIRAIINFINGDGNVEKADLTTSIKRYYNELKNYMTGKNGMVARICSARTDQSARAVIVPSMRLDWDTIGMPETLMNACGLKEGEWVVFSRHPVVHEGSNLFLKIAKIPKRIVEYKSDTGTYQYSPDTHAMHLSPIYMDSLDADFDGDACCSIRLPDGFEQQAIELSHEQKRHCCWPKELCIEENTSQEVDWLRFYEDTNTRRIITGRSIGPEDVVHANGYFEHIHKVMPKKFNHEEIMMYGRGIRPNARRIEGESTFEDVCRHLVLSMALTKMLVGKIGAATDRIVSVSRNQDEKRAATVIKQLLTTLSMDFKHVEDPQKLEADIVHCVNLINDKIPYIEKEQRVLTLDEYVNEFSNKFDEFERDKIFPIVNRLYEFGAGSRKLFQSCCPIFSLTKGGKVEPSFLYRIGERQDQYGIGQSVMFQLPMMEEVTVMAEGSES